jgi:folate/biopterin transporter
MSARRAAGSSGNTSPLEAAPQRVRTAAAAAAGGAEDGSQDGAAAATASEHAGTPDCVRRVPFLGTLCGHFGWRPVAGLGLTFFVLRGIGMNATASAQLPFFRDTLGVTDSADYQRLTTIPLFGWALKPGVGLLTDALPLWGYHKRSYVIVATVLTTTCFLAAAYIASRAKGTAGYSPWLALFGSFLFFGIQFGLASADLLTESIYAKLMASRKEAGSSIVTWCWSLAALGGIVAVAVCGPLADAGMITTILLGAAVSMPLASLPSALNWHRERKYASAVNGGGGSSSIVRSPTPGFHRYRGVASSVDAGVDDDKDANPSSTRFAAAPSPSLFNIRRRWEQLQEAVAIRLGATEVGKHPKVAIFAAAMAASTTLVALSAAFLAAEYRAVLLAVLVLFLACLGFECLPPIAARALVFMFAKEALYIQIPGAMDYFYTADEACVPGGPHFDYWYYQTVTGFVGSLATAAGTLAFEKLFSSRPYVVVFLVTTIMKIAASVVDLIIVTRYNVRSLGLTDKETYLWGDAVIYTAVSWIDFMPLVVLTSRLCPPGIETIMYALLAGFSNFGSNVSRTVGEFMIHGFGVKTSVPCDFSHLPSLIVIAHGAAPLFAIPLAYLLLPARRMNEPLHPVAEDGNDVEQEEAAAGDSANESAASANVELELAAVPPSAYAPRQSMIV